ncbi:hypothetical protein SteCoe_34381 [Stentor coeruleus]|uniref:Palmitoyltransferase n=1 Tax=Stentor coeruleus TaxID=5963 RepID=A0A1R2AUU4_9CILI|nr:hypothetical protein SteCoe_34381 [Stentor coeruleus]
MTAKVLNTLSIALTNSNKRYFKDIVEEMIEFQNDIQEDDGYNIFHMLAKGTINESGLIDFIWILSPVLQVRFSESFIKDLLRARAKRESNLTPLQLAITRCKSKIAEVFIKLGADPLQIDKNGKNALHLAASYGTLALFCFLVQDLSLSINPLDDFNNTPLHLSIRERHEDMSLIILAQTIELDLQNSNGETPLHIAVMTGNYRIVRHLLYKGAKIDIENFSNQRPIEICNTRDIKSLLRSKPPAKSYKYLVLVIIALCVQSGSLACIEQQKYQSDFKYSATSSGIFIISLSFFIYLSCKNPGYEYGSDMLLRELYEKYNAEFVCPYCSLKKHKGTHHCITCHKCIKNFDHHCKWINNCVGLQNSRIFISMLIWMLFQSLAGIFVGSWLLCKSWSLNSIHYFEVIFLTISILIFIVISPVAISTVKNAYKKKKLYKSDDIKPQAKAINFDISSDTESMLLYQKSECSDIGGLSRKSSAV